jgi:hypothetical protein
MIYHASIPADEPERVARVIAELWRGEYFPFVFLGTFIVFAGDDRGTHIEVCPRGQEGIPGKEQSEIQTNPSPSPYSAVHLNVATPLRFDEIRTIADREGWIVRLSPRGPGSKLIELWLENKLLLELMTSADVEQYRRSTTIEGYRATMAAFKAQGLSMHEWERYKPVASGPPPEPKDHRKT